MEINFKDIEAKWQKYWDDNHTFEAKTGANLIIF